MLKSSSPSFELQKIKETAEKMKMAKEMNERANRHLRQNPNSKMKKKVRRSRWYRQFDL